MNAARTFVHSYFLTRHVDIPGMLNFRNPKHVLGVEMRRLGLSGGIESRFVACDFSIDHLRTDKDLLLLVFLADFSQSLADTPSHLSSLSGSFCPLA